MSDNTLILDDFEPVVEKKKPIGIDRMGRLQLMILISSLVYYVILSFIIGIRSVGFFFYPYLLWLSGYLFFAVVIPRSFHVRLQRRISRGQYESALSCIRKTGYLSLFAYIGMTLLGFVIFFFVTETLLSIPKSYIAGSSTLLALLFLYPQGRYIGFLFKQSSRRLVFRSEIIRGILLFTGLPFAYYLYRYGDRVDALLHTNYLSCSYAAFGAGIGLLLSSFASFLYLFIEYHYHFKKTKGFFEDSPKTDSEHSGMKQSVPVYALVFIVPIVCFVLMTIILFYRTGTQETDAAIQLGQLLIHAMSVPLLISAVFVLSFMKGIYRLSAMVEHADYSSASRLFRHIRYFLLFYSFPAAFFGFVLTPTFLRLVFRVTTVQAEQAVRIFALTSLFFPISILGGILFLRLKRNGVIYVNTLIYCILLLPVVLTDFIAFPSQILSIPVVFTIVYMLYSALVLFELSVMLNASLHPVQEIGKKAVSAFLGAVLIHLLNSALYPVIGEALSILISLFFGSSVYLLLLVFLRGIDTTTLYHVIGGSFLVTTLKRLRILK